MFDCTRRRAGLLIRPDRQVAVVTQEHRKYFGPLSSDLAPGCLVVLPSNQGTLAGIVYSVMRVEHLAGDVPIAGPTSSCRMLPASSSAGAIWSFCQA